MRHFLIIAAFIFASFDGQSQENIFCIDSLKVGGKYIITVMSNGCFQNKKTKLIIYRNFKGYFAKAKVNDTTYGERINKSSKNYKDIELSTQILDSIRLFEIELTVYSEQTNACTTVDTYYLKINDIENNYRIENCIWKGIEKLMYLIFERSHGSL